MACRDCTLMAFLFNSNDSCSHAYKTVDFNQKNVQEHKKLTMHYEASNRTNALQCCEAHHFSSMVCWEKLSSQCSYEKIIREKDNKTISVLAVNQ